MIDNVRIGSITYPVTETAEPIIVDNAVCYGAIDYVKPLIQINANCGAHKPATLMHEIMHGIVNEYRIEYVPAGDEKAIDLIAKGILNVLIDNPQLIEQVTNYKVSKQQV